MILTGLGRRTLQEGNEADRLEKAVLARHRAMVGMTARP